MTPELPIRETRGRRSEPVPRRSHCRFSSRSSSLQQHTLSEPRHRLLLALTAFLASFLPSLRPPTTLPAHQAFSPDIAESAPTQAYDALASRAAASLGPEKALSLALAMLGGGISPEDLVAHAHKLQRAEVARHETAQQAAAEATAAATAAAAAAAAAATTTTTTGVVEAGEGAEGRQPHCHVHEQQQPREQRATDGLVEVARDTMAQQGGSAQAHLQQNWMHGQHQIPTH